MYDNYTKCISGFTAACPHSHTLGEREAASRDVVREPSGREDVSPSSTARRTARPLFPPWSLAACHPVSACATHQRREHRRWASVSRMYVGMVGTVWTIYGSLVGIVGIPVFPA